MKSSSPGSGRVEKGAVNVAQTGRAACKSRTALSARGEERSSRAGYHRCHGEHGSGDRPSHPDGLRVWLEGTSGYVSLAGRANELYSLARR